MEAVARTHEHGIVFPGLQVVEEALAPVEEGMHIAKRMIVRLEVQPQLVCFEHREAEGEEKRRGFHALSSAQTFSSAKSNAAKAWSICAGVRPPMSVQAMPG